MVPTDLEGHAVDVEYSDVHVEDGSHQSRWKRMTIAMASTGFLVYFSVRCNVARYIHNSQYDCRQ